ncbi:TIGR03915 family putative DNA repair protein [Thermoanaerobacterium sp. RBIITD]|uniref:TIGR03915 family putative DNA repair protein n=1 Tax=Thermoanaerobacterium sp. RBIITD TaxID=1550240 RepID=UPI000BB75F25|nr:TIGR03915 family putative DNA repair protein [Thermoanaerobacterium sp. RBIITD]SNX53116.1 probable DNA metabolism protein [Thermoanaerobacterium sp. RBIITD]
MLNYLFDGSFDGLMTVIYESYYKHQVPDNIIIKGELQQNMLSQNIYIETDIEKSEKVQNAIKNKISRESLKNIFYAYLSELDSSYILIYKYIRMGFKLGKKIDNYLSNETVFNVHKIRQKVSHESHKMIELIRFKEIKKGLYYAKIHPDYNVLCLIVPHFASRFQNQYFMINDIRRNITAIYDKNDWIITDMLPENIMLTNDEENYENLWKVYYENIAIKERKNPRLQRQNMPKKYWDLLVEKS